jgi:N4-gp56 family major capsid protein
MAVQGFSSFSSDSSTYIAAKTLMRIKRDVVVYGLGKKEKLPSNNSKTFQFTRYEKLALPQDPITDGVTPNNASMSINVVTAVMDQWGSYVNLSDVAQISIKHPVVQEAIGVLAEQAAETIDREAIKILLANTSVYFPGAVANRGALSATDYIDSAVIRKVTAALRRGGARGYEGRMFVGLVDPSVEQDLNTDTTFVNAASYSNIVVLQNGEVGKWMGVRWVASNLIPTLARITGASGAGSATAGSLAASTTYYFKVSAVEDATGFETGVSVEFTGATGVGQSSVDITIPNVSGYTYKVYAGSSTGGSFVTGIAGKQLHSDIVKTMAIGSTSKAEIEAFVQATSKRVANPLTDMATADVAFLKGKSWGTDAGDIGVRIEGFDIKITTVAGAEHANLGGSTRKAGRDRAGCFHALRAYYFIYFKNYYPNNRFLSLGSRGYF